MQRSPSAKKCADTLTDILRDLLRPGVVRKLCRVIILQVVVQRVAPIIIGLSQIGLVVWMLSELEPNRVRDSTGSCPFALATGLMAFALLCVIALSIRTLMPLSRTHLAAHGREDGLGISQQNLVFAHQQRAPYADVPPDKPGEHEMQSGFSRQGRGQARMAGESPGSQQEQSDSAASWGSCSDSFKPRVPLRVTLQMLSAVPGFKRFSRGSRARGDSSLESGVDESRDHAAFAKSESSHSAYAEFYQSLAVHGGAGLAVSRAVHGFEWLVAQRSWRTLSDASKVSRAAIEIAWAVFFVVYAELWAHRSVCLFNRPCPSQCDAWVETAVPTSVFVAEAVFLWVATIEYAVRRHPAT